MAVSTSQSAKSLPDTCAGHAEKTRAADAERGPRIAHLRPLDGLRGIAVLAVVVFHFSPDIAPGGFLGVDMFFVLSGFLITSLLVAERESTGHTKLREFWIRRARRLFPALFLVLIAVGLWSIFIATPLETTRLRDDGFATIGYFANWRFIFSGQSYIEQFIGIGPSPLRHTWSLAIEEQFYLVWPLIVAGVGVLLARRAAAGHPMPSIRRAIVVLCLVAAAASVVVMALLYHPGDDPSRVYYGTDSRAHLLLIGAALGAASAGVVALTRDVARKAIIVVGSIAAAALVVAFLTVDPTDSWLYEAGYGGIAIGVTLIIAAAGQPGTNPLARLLEVRPLVGLGLISYGVYLWHWPIVVWLDAEETGLDGVALFALRSVLTLGVSVASYYMVEMPIRRGALRKLNPNLPRVLAPVAVLMAVVVLVLPTVGVARVQADDDVPSAAPSQSSTQTTATYADAARCDGPPPSPDEIGDGASVLLVGNSYTEEIVPCLSAILTARGSEVVRFSNSGAAVCDLLPRLQADPTKKPDVAVLYFFPVTFRECTGGTEGAAFVKRWANDTRKLTKLFRDRGAQVFLVPPVPPAQTKTPDPLAAKFRAIAADDPDGVFVLDAGTFLRDRGGMYQWTMPCLEGGEPGCDPGTGTVAVRNTYDDGKHMCLELDGTRRGRNCPPESAAGARRASAALAAKIVRTIDQGKP